MDESKLEEIEFITTILPFPENLYKVDKEDYKKAFIEYVVAKHSVLPELSNIVDFDSLLKILYVFSGQTLSFPKQTAISLGIRDLDIYFSLKRQNDTTEINRLSIKYNATTSAITQINTKVSKILDK
mgnify:FL=1